MTLLTGCSQSPSQPSTPGSPPVDRPLAYSQPCILTVRGVRTWSPRQEGLSAALASPRGLCRRRSHQTPAGMLRAGRGGREPACLLGTFTALEGARLRDTARDRGSLSPITETARRSQGYYTRTPTREQTQDSRNLSGHQVTPGREHPSLNSHLGHPASPADTLSGEMCQPDEGSLGQKHCGFPDPTQDPLRWKHGGRLRREQSAWAHSGASPQSWPTLPTLRIQIHVRPGPECP